jgi:hypothetical protein
MVQLILSVPNVSMRVYSTNAPGAVAFVTDVVCWDEQLRSAIVIARESKSLLMWDSVGMGG